MNFKTTIVLIVILAIVGVLVWVNTGEPPAPKEAPEQPKLLGVTSTDIQKIRITPTSGPSIALARGTGTQWRMTEPTTAPADEFTAQAVADALANLQSRATIDPQGADAAATGLEQPAFRVEADTKDGKTIKLEVGNHSGAGDGLYVRKDGDAKAQIVPADLFEQINKEPSAFRSTQLMETKTPEVKAVEIARPAGNISLKKEGNGWTIASPTTMPADETEVSDLLFAVTGLRAAEFVSDKAADASMYQLDHPQATVTLHSEPAASTQPTTQQVATVVKIGRYQDITKKNVFAMVDGGPIVAVPASIVTTLDKKPIELRDKKVLTIPPAQVTKVTIDSDRIATTQPTSRPASKKQLVIAHAPPEPATTQATTSPATTQTSRTTAKTKQWNLVSPAGGEVDDSAVNTMLESFDPLKAEKFIETSATQPTTRPADKYVVTIETGGRAAAPARKFEIKITDPGGTNAPIAVYNGLTFEISRSLLEKLQGDFKPGSTPAHATPNFPPVGAPE
ncbi:MAG TPA: DUF4340 domain-containing protein [Tepidisphaeraceae bacterium]|jgi:hypothetical protein|nr:DUF4340 domain-containing protein [Tepidisphaeraceae bacterium]